jgi:hypothetical protein
VAEEHGVSHGDILYKLGCVEGKVEGKLDTLAKLVADRQADLSEVFRRLGEVEKRPDPAPIAKELQDVKIRVAQGACLLGVLILFTPLLWQAISPRLHFGEPPAEASGYEKH